MFLVKNTREEKGRKKKWRISDIFSDLQRLTAPVTNWIKGQWRFSSPLQGFLVVPLSEAFSFLSFFCGILGISVFLTTIAGSKIMQHVVRALKAKHVT